MLIHAVIQARRLVELRVPGCVLGTGDRAATKAEGPSLSGGGGLAQVGVITWQGQASWSGDP